MSNFKTVQWLNALISAFGLGMCALAVLLFSKGISFPVLLMTGVSGLAATVFGLSLMVDMHRYKNQSRKPEF